MPVRTQRLVPQLDRWVQWLCCACLTLSLNTASLADDEAVDTVFQISDEAPAGFESLSTEQTTFVDIRFNGKFVGSSSITGNEEIIRFDSPEAVTGLLYGLSDPTAVQTLLSEALPTNTDRLCHEQADPPGCGTVDAEPIAIIYDQQSLVVDVFVAPELQQIQSRQKRQYLDTVAARPSSIVSVDAVASAIQDEPAAIDLSGGILAGYGHGYLNTEADYSSRSGRKRLRSLTLTHHLRDHEIRVGSYSFQPGGAINGFDLLGVSLASSLHSRLDLEQAFSTELIVFFPRRALVQLVVDDRVYAASSYQAGNQALDTRALPDGNYELEIRIVDPLTGNRTERRQFTKSARIPPRGETIYQLTAGVPLRFNEDHVFPERVPLSVVSASASRRLLDSSALTFGLSKLADVNLVQSEYVFLGRRFSMQLSGSLGSSNTRSSALRGNWSKGRFNANLSGEWFASDRRSSPETDAFELFPANYRQFAASMSRSFGKLTLSLRAGMRQESALQQTSRRSRTSSLTLRRPLLISRSLRGSVQAGLQRDIKENRISLDLAFTFGQASDALSTVSSNINRTGKDDNNHSLNLASKWHSPEGDDKRWQAGIQLGTSETGENASIGASIDHQRFLASIDAQWSQQHNQDAILSSVARFSTQLGIDPGGATLTGADRARSGLILAVTGDPADASFDILIDGARYGVGTIGSTQLIKLHPYREYTLQLLPRAMLGSTMLQDTFSFTLYPGMLERIQVEARHRILLVGTLVDVDGQLIEQAYIDQHPNPLLIDTGGFVQMEATPGERIPVRQRSGEICHFVVPADTLAEEVVVATEPLRCLADFDADP